MNDLESKIQEQFDGPLSVQQNLVETMREETSLNRQKIKNWPQLKGNLKKRTFPRFALWLKALKKNTFQMPTGPYRREFLKLAFYEIGAPFHWRTMLVKTQIGIMSVLRLAYLTLLFVLSISAIFIIIYLVYKALMSMFIS